MSPPSPPDFDWSPTSFDQAGQWSDSVLVMDGVHVGEMVPAPLSPAVPEISPAAMLLIGMAAIVFLQAAGFWSRWRAIQ